MDRKRISKRLGTMRKRCRDKGWDFDLTMEWYIEKLSYGRCEVTGLKFDISKFDSNTYIPAYLPTVDRIDSKKGYTKDNCQLVIMAYNQAKNEYTISELLTWAEKFVEKYENETLLE